MGTTTLRRGLEILRVLGSEEAPGQAGLRVVQVADRLGYDKSQVSRTLKTLAEAGFVDRNPDSLAYRLGWHLFVLAARAGHPGLVEKARPLLVRLVKETGERSHLSVLKGTEVLTVHSEPSPRAVQAAGWVGRTVPAYCTSSGRALLIDCDRGELEAVFSGSHFPSAGPNAPRDVADLSRRVLAARARGFAVADEEFEAGLIALAAPVRDLSGRVVAALNVSAPKFRLADRLEESALATKAAAGELSARLGGSFDGAPGSEEGGGAPRGPIRRARR